jgi:hypothetical protein
MARELFEACDDIKRRASRLVPDNKSHVEEMVRQLTDTRPEVIQLGDVVLKLMGQICLQHVSAIPTLMDMLKVVGVSAPGDSARQGAVIALVHVVHADSQIPEEQKEVYGLLYSCALLNMALWCLFDDQAVYEWLFQKNVVLGGRDECRAWLLKCSQIAGGVLPRGQAPNQLNWRLMYRDFGVCRSWDAVSTLARELGVDVKRQIPTPIPYKPGQSSSSGYDGYAQMRAEQERILKYQLDHGTFSVSLPQGGSVATDGHGIYISENALKNL